MINSQRILFLNTCGIAACFVSVALIAGCHGLSLQPKPVITDPVLPMSTSREELVAHINRHAHNLSSWRCLDTQIKIRMPNGLRHRLNGMIACEAPSNFRLTARNVLASADLGTNEQICWFYMKPGDSPLIMWAHEDAALLDQVSLGFPRIEPRWLMNVLGIVPLRAEDFSLSTGPAGSKELWLQAIVEKPNGQAARRAIKVDTMTGHVREHVIYDADRNPIIRANLSNYKTIEGSVLPTQVDLEFPNLDMEIELSFPKIEPNAATARNLWQMPTGNSDVMNLGAEIRRQLNSPQVRNDQRQMMPYPAQPQAYSAPPQAYSPEPADPRHPDRSADRSADREDSPFFDEPPVDNGELFAEDSDEPAIPVEPEWDSPPPPTKTVSGPPKNRWWPWGRN